MKNLKILFRHLALTAAITACTGAVSNAQQSEQTAKMLPDRLVSMDTPSEPETNHFQARIGGHFFGGRERSSFGSLEVDYSLRNQIEIMLRADGAEYKDFKGNGFVIRHGGRDAELLAKYRLKDHPDFAFTVGVSAPHTPAQNQVYFTAQALLEHQFCSKVGVNLAVKTVAISHNTLVGLAAGGSYRFSDDLQLVADVTGIASGKNTRSTTTGRLERAIIWGVAARYTPKFDSNRFSVELGAGNALGSTTGFSMTPGLGGSAAIYFGINYRH